MKITKILPLIAFAVLLFPAFASAEDCDCEISYPYNKTFTITAYYSPIEGQDRYVTGSLESDRRLNGNGTNGADGTEVFPGMIAAPKTIPFGTKMSIPGIGTVSVHDRGGAIVPAGERGEKYDRLDVWMGKGDAGLARALAWGKRDLTVKVYGQDSSVKESVDLSALDKVYFATSTSSKSSPRVFTNDLGYGDEGDDVEIMQKKLIELGYLDHSATGEFLGETHDAVLAFQIDNEIVSSADSFGAGYFGPQTRSTLEKAMNDEDYQKYQKNEKPIITLAKADKVDVAAEKVQLAGNGLTFLSQDLEIGSEGQAVIELQTELRKLHFLGITPTGYYGDVTAHAVFKFQQSQGIVSGKDDSGAGRLGPSTRQALSNLVNKRVNVREQILAKSGQDELLAQN